MPDAVPARKCSPLQGLEGPALAVSLVERAFIGKVNLRGDPDDDDFLDGAKTVLAAPLPLTPNTTARASGFTIFWMGPDEWLIHTPEDGQTVLTAELRQALANCHAAVTDVSDYYVVIRLAGPQARSVLAKGCPLDLHPRVFWPGQCTQSLYGKAPILMHQIDDVPTYDLQVRWSFTEYLWQYLTHAAGEFAGEQP